MIISCPVCTSRLQIDAKRFLGKRVTLRCARCAHVFKTVVGAPPAAADGDIRVLVAHSDPELCEVVGTLLAREGFSCEVCHDGESALRIMDASPPRVALMDVALPGLFGFEVVEKVRSRAGLSEVRIILLSSVFNKAAYKRTPSSLYGADDYIEKHHLIDRLIPKIRQLVSVAVPSPLGPPVEPVPATTGESESLNERLRTAEERETLADGADDRIEKARRLARIIVSDIALYNQDKVKTGVGDGSFFALLKDEIAEGCKLYEKRVDADVRAKTDFLKEEFKNFIARQRGQSSR